MKALPVGISTFRFLIDDEMVYVDKTHLVAQMTATKGRFFLSRPRRFGKTLLVDTLKELFEGNERLFEGLAIHDRWDWNRRFPVLKIDFSGGVLKSPEDLDNKLNALFNRYSEAFGIQLRETGTANRFAELILAVEKKSGSPAVVLVDEYDKPLLDNIDAPGRAVEMSEALKNLYSPLKEMDAHLQFVFLTGVSKFSKVNIFSGINNLQDITLDPRFAAVCGYTQREVEEYFAEHLDGVDWDKLREWYNGYSFLGDSVYNPFDILLFISGSKIYRNYWFETGTPTFLIKLFHKHDYFLPELEGLEAGEELLGSFDVDDIEPATLLFQSGYLTIGKVQTIMDVLSFTLVFPNREVRSAFNDQLLTSFTGITLHKQRLEYQTWQALKEGDIATLEGTIRRLFASIPWENYRGNAIAESEGYYASVLYAFFSAINSRIIAEDTTNRGQIDLTVMVGDKTYVIEIKVVEKWKTRPESDLQTDTETSPAFPKHNPALQQIRSRDYARKYLDSPDSTLFEVGMVFSKMERNLVRFDYAVRS